MAIPNTNTFSLNDVRVELGLGATTDLVACFSAAEEGLFDPTYQGSKNELNDFRNYGAIGIRVSPTGILKNASAQSFNVTITTIPAGGSWTSSEACSWLSVSPTSGTTTTPTITLSANGTGLTRVCQVTFTYSSRSCTLFVTQTS